MANSVGSISIDLEARIARFEADMGRAARIADQQAAAMRRSIGTIAGVLGAGISIAGITNFVKSAIDAQDAISKMSQKVGVSTEALSGWNLAAKQAGVEGDAFQKGLVKLAQSSAMVLQGSKQQIDAFKSIGVSALDSKGHLKNLDTLFPQVIDKLSKYRDGTAKTAVATMLFGRAGADLIPLINAGSKGLEHYTKMARDFGSAVGGESAKAAERFNDAIQQLGFVSQGVANKIATALAPALADLAEKASAFFQSDSWANVLDTISEGAQAVADHIGDVVAAVKTLLSNLDAIAVFFAARLVFARIAAGFGVLSIATDVLSAAMVILRGALAAVGGWVGIVVTALAALAVGVYKYATRTTEAQQATDSYAKLLDKLHGASADALGDSRKLAEARAEEAKKTIVAAQAELALMQVRLQGYQEAQKRLEPAAHVFGGRADSRMGASYATTAADQTQKNIATQKAFIDANKKGLQGILDFLSTSVAPPKETAVTGLATDLNIVNEAAKAATAALDAYKKKQAELSAKAASVVAGYNGKIEAPDTKAWSDYAAAVQQVAESEGQRIQVAIDAQKAGVKGIDLAKVEASAQQAVANAIDNMSDARKRSIAAAEDEINVGQRMAAQALQQANLSGLTERDAAIARAGIAAENELKQKNIQLNDVRYAQNVKIAQQGAAVAFDIQKQMAFQKQVAQEFSGFWENAASSVSKAVGDLVVSGLRKWKDFGAGLKSIATQFVSDIISQFIRLRVLGPLLSGVMGSMGGLLGIAGGFGASSLTQAANYYGGGSTISGSPNATGGGNSYGGMLSNISAAKSLYGSMTGGGPAFGGYLAGGNYVSGPGFGTGATGYGVNLPNGTVMDGNGTTLTPASPYGGTIGSTGISYAGVGGALAGAAWGLGRGSGGISTAASTGIGAVGGYYAGTALATGISGGVAAGMAAIPVAGWIALAAMAVDQISGGKLFGTKYQATAADQAFSLTAGGGVISSTLTQQKQRALFGGRKTKVSDQAVTPEMQAAADQFFDGVKKTMVQGALQLGVTVPAMIEASLKTHSTIKKGKVTGTDYIVDYLGQTWKEATAEAAAQRIGAEALVSVVAASAGDVAQSIAQQFRSSAETLADGAQAMLAAQTDINRGNELVALGTSATLAQVIAFTQSMQAAGEKLADTYSRLAQASASYLQFVGQFEPAGVGFAYTMQQINKTMLANISQANDLAIAAGLSGAREKDLANIHRFAAQQAADAIASLSAASQDLATSLYGTVQGLAHATTITAQLTSKLQASTQLAIGDNSPLNDKAKLDIALKGLRSGITSADDVLSLGRKLYASSADYTGLYNKVTDILGMSKASGGSDDLSAALTNYNKLSAQAAAAARFGDAKQLAQNISDISSVQGVGYGDIASGLGVNLQDLAKDLGLTDIRGYLDTLKQEDVGQSVMSSSATIVDAIRGIGHDIVAAILGGPVVVPGPTSIKNIGTASEDQAALLAKISAQLADIQQTNATTATTNTQMVKQGVTSDLRSISGSTRATA